MERISGRDAAKPIGNREFRNIHYLRRILFCVFNALHDAQKQLAFHHADLRLPNIMEVNPDVGLSLAVMPDSPIIGSHQDASQLDAALLPQQLTLHRSDHAIPQPLAETHSDADLFSSSVPPKDKVSKTHPRDLAGFETSQSCEAHFKVSKAPCAFRACIKLSQSLSSNRPATASGCDITVICSSHFTSVNNLLAVHQIIDFGLADFRETYGAGYVAGKTGKLIHKEPHSAQPLYSLDAKGIKQQPTATDPVINQKRACSHSCFALSSALLPEVIAYWSRHAASRCCNIAHACQCCLTLLQCVQALFLHMDVNTSTSCLFICQNVNAGGGHLQHVEDAKSLLNTQAHNMSLFRSP